MATSTKNKELNDNNTCKICLKALPRYSCPRCNILYCSLNCYQSQQHLDCSEEFYKSCIKDELFNNNNENNREISDNQIVEILKRNHENFDDNPHLDSDDDTDTDIDDLEYRLNGIDLNNADEIWLKLTSNEQQDFINFLQTNNDDDLTKLIPNWQPWWCLIEPKLIEDYKEIEKFKENCPKLMEIIDFCKISQKQPADCVRYNLINLLTAYVFTTRYLNGEHHDFYDEATACIVDISLTLKNNENFADYETAVKSVEMQCVESDWISADTENYKLMFEDIERILKGPNTIDKNYYILAALSDIKQLFNRSMKNFNKTTKKLSKFNKLFPNDHFPKSKLIERAKIKQCSKKVDYLLSYTKDHFIS